MMKSLIVTLALFAVAASADVSHLNLNNEYLPPVHSGVDHLSSTNSYTAQPQQLQNIEYSQPQKSVEYPQQQTIEYTQVKFPQGLGGETITPAHLSVEHEIPFAIGADTITPAHLAVEPLAAAPEFVADVPVQEPAGPVSQFSAYAQQDAQQQTVVSGIDTQYGANGGYIY